MGNPHIFPAGKHDQFPAPVATRSTFPIPLPPYLPRTTPVPNANHPTSNPATANAGRFSLSLKGIRRDLRRLGPRVHTLVKDIDNEIILWLQHTGGAIKPQSTNAINVNYRTPIGSNGTVYEVSRTSLELIWILADNAFARYIVHCCARYHEVVSFSELHF